MEKQIVVFELNSELFGVDIAAVESIIKMQPVTAMPHAPAFVEGVINLRGKVLPVIDLRRRFAMEAHEASKNSRIIVVNVDGVGVGMTVDAVSEVLTLPEQAVEPAPAITATVASRFITGIAKIESRLIILLDLSRVLSSQEQGALAEIAV